MPGLTLRLTGDARRGNGGDVRQAQTLLLHGPHYRIGEVASGPRIDLGWVAYDGYPIRVYSNAAHLVYLEGRVYNRPAASVQADLEALAPKVLAPQRDDAAVERFIVDNEGSYVVAVVRPETDEAVVFSDPFGRLPVYYSVSESSLILSRAAKFVQAFDPAPTFDRLGCAQFLAFGLPLGDRTVLEGVKSFPDAGLLRAEVLQGRIRWSIRRLHRWNLDDEDRTRTARQHAAEFSDLFVPACRRWGSHADSRGNLVSLSGGHDSRLVVAGLARSGAGVVAVTYRDPSGKREAEVSCARQVTQAIGAEWHCLDLPAPAESAYEELAWLKDGMNWASMAYILSYLMEIVRRWGPGWTYLSGDGGDDCLKVTAPRRRYRQLDDVVQYVLDKETCIPADHAEAILRLTPGSLRAELRTVFESYPERDLARRIKHFKIFERGRRCYFEGEDRTRAFLWEDSPFYSLPLFQQCMRVPDQQKYYKAFCREALLAVSPAAASTPVISSGYAPASWKYSLYHRAKDLALELPDSLVRLARQLRRSAQQPPYTVPGPFIAYLQEQLASDTPLRALLDGNEVLRTVQKIDDPHSFFCLWTVVMLEKAYRSRSRVAAPVTPGAR